MTCRPIIELDLHGSTVEEAVREVEACLDAADGAVYRIRVIHGYRRGNSIGSALRREPAVVCHGKVKRILPGDNPGITEIVLREY